MFVRGGALSNSCLITHRALGRTVPTTLPAGRACPSRSASARLIGSLSPQGDASRSTRDDWNHEAVLMLQAELLHQGARMMPPRIRQPRSWLARC